MQAKLLVVVRGQVYEESAEIYIEKAKNFSTLAYHDLSKDPWIVKFWSEKLAKMKQLQKL